MKGKTINIKYFYLVIGICILLAGCLLLSNRDKKPKDKVSNEITKKDIAKTKDIESPYDMIFRSFTGVIQVMDVYPDEKIINKDVLTQDDEFNIITQLLTKNDYTESDQKADFNEELAKYRTIKKSTLDNLIENYFDDHFDLPDTIFIFPYSYTLTGDSYIGEAIITGIVGEPGWQYEPVSYTLSNDKLSITGFAYYDDFYEGQMCADALCNKAIDGANYENILNYKDSFPHITINFDRKGSAYRFVNITKGE